MADRFKASKATIDDCCDQRVHSVSLWLDGFCLSIRLEFAEI